MFIWKPIATMVLKRLIDFLNNLSQADLDALVDKLNAKIGGDKKIEALTLHIVVDAVKTLLGMVKI